MTANEYAVRMTHYAEDLMELVADQPDNELARLLERDALTAKRIADALTFGHEDEVAA